MSASALVCAGLDVTLPILSDPGVVDAEHV